MIKRVLFSVLIYGWVAFAALAATTTAAEPRKFHCSGSGVFSPTNIGTDMGGNAAIAIGDGSESSKYVASSHVFTIGGDLVDSGLNEHTGEVVARTTGILKQDQRLVRWPVKSGDSHVLHSDDDKKKRRG